MRHNEDRQILRFYRRANDTLSPGKNENSQSLLQNVVLQNAIYNLVVTKIRVAITSWIFLQRLEFPNPNSHAL